MAEDENSWVFDSLVCFLNGPIWDAPIQNFIEEKSLIFEPNNSDNEEEYLKIFEEYKNLVDFMLGNFMEDMGITSAQFEYACFKGHQHRETLRFDHSIFEQIWAANNYEMFKKMMTQRNVELQLQALELIEKKYGIMPQSFIPSKKTSQASVGIAAEETQESYQTKVDIEQAVLEEVAKKFPEEKLTEVPEIESLLEEKQILETTRDQINYELAKTEENLSSIQREQNRNELAENNTGKLQESNQGESKLKKTTDETDISILKNNLVVKQTVNQQIDQIELKKRQEYLRRQRDKLVALKKEERRKQFASTDNEASVKKTRPNSAKAATDMLNGENSAIPSQELQLRKALAERLKHEVVNKQNM